MKRFFDRIFKHKERSISRRRDPNDPKRYRIGKRIGEGTFGFVYKGRDRQAKKDVAVKKVVVNESTEAELAFNQELSHINVTGLIGFFREARKNTQPPVIQLCLVLEYSEKSLKDVMDKQMKKRKPLTQQVIMLYAYQMFRALNYLHKIGIMHRDVKPSNFLIASRKTNILRICDFGSAARLVAGEPKNTGVVSKPYRAPELELLNQDYNEKIDIWAAGCIFTELCINERLFRDQFNVRHYDAICQLLGDPTLEDIYEMLPLARGQTFTLGSRPSSIDQRLTNNKPYPPLSARTLIKRILQFKPSRRPSGIEVCADPYFNQLRQMQEYDPILYNYSNEELTNVSVPIMSLVIPPRCRNPIVLKKIAEQHMHDLQDGMKSIGSHTVWSGGSAGGSAGSQE